MRPIDARSMIFFRRSRSRTQFRRPPPPLPYRFPLLDGYNGLLGPLTYARPSLANVDRSNLRPETTSQAPPALPAGPDAGAAVPLQSGLRWMRQDPVSGAHSEEKPFARRMFQSRG